MKYPTYKFEYSKQLLEIQELLITVGLHFFKYFNLFFKV